MEKNNRQFIAYGLTQDEASAAAHHLINIIKCASENIIITTDPTVIYSLRTDETNLVGVKAHATDQSQWCRLMPVCRHMKAQNIKFQIIK
jgi:hypothetical protein